MRKKVARLVLCIVAFFVGFYGSSFLTQSEAEKVNSFKLPKITVTYTPPDPTFAFECKANREAAKIIMSNVLEIFETIDEVELPTQSTQLTSLGNYYITGYTSIECGGSTTTASGTTCHKAASIADSIDNPTTCAIDPALHDFGDIFYIEGFGYFIAEDTGSAVKGKHLDLYFWDDEYNYALSITGKYEVFAVEYVETTFQAGAYDIRDMVAEQVTGWSIKTIEEGEANG